MTASANQPATDGEMVDGNVVRLAVRNLQTTLERLIDADARALSMAARAGQLVRDGALPADVERNVVEVMDQIVRTSIEARKTVADIGRTFDPPGDKGQKRPALGVSLTIGPDGLVLGQDIDAQTDNPLVARPSRTGRPAPSRHRIRL